MKNFLIIFFVTVVFGCKSQMTAQVIQDPAAVQIEQDIIGTWVSNDDDLWKISFDDNGVRKDYYENILKGTYAYSISNSCNGQSLSNEFFLKTTDMNGENVTCDFINAFSTNDSGEKVMSITTERGQLSLFTRE